MDLGADVTNITVNLSAKVGVEGLKIAGDLAKQILLIILEKQKESQKSKTGIVALKTLLKSGEELQTVKINKSNLENFKQRAKELGITFAGISSQESNETRIIFKSIQMNLVKEIMKDMIQEKTKETEKLKTDNKVFDAINRIDIPDLNEEEKIYRHEVKNISLEKIKFISDKLKGSGIESDVSVKQISDDLETGEKEAAATIDFKVAAKDKDRAIEIIEELKEKSIEELKECVNNKSLDEVIEDATQKSMLSSQDTNEHKREKVRAQHQER